MTVIYPSPIFGPVHSRRLGVSLGINLLPEDGKCCTFDCIYCECGFNKQHPAHSKLPTVDEVVCALENKLRDMKLSEQVKNIFRRLRRQLQHENKSNEELLTYIMDTKIVSFLIAFLRSSRLIRPFSSTGR